MCILAIVSILLLGIGRVNGLEQYIEDADRFPGWKGELPNALHVDYKDSVGLVEAGKELWKGRIEQVSWEPRAYILHEFLSDLECEHLIDLSKSRLKKSSVVDSKTGGSVDSDVRTSSGTFLSHHQDDIVKGIEKRIAAVTMLPEENGESLQILRYVDGQKYEPHTDYFHDKVNSDPGHGGQRIATVLMYLTTPDEGGETVFPYGSPKVEGPEWSECAKKGLAVKAVKGNALLFWGLKPDGKVDPKSTHGSCPTLRGVKFSATKWLHVSSFQSSIHSKIVGCQDYHESCEEWAEIGECEKNVNYMISKCPKSCNACEKKKNYSNSISQSRKGRISN
jgi:prolyl 4-hydroxylase